MVPGFNTDFKYRGETYHIQTEDNGVANPVVVTLLYHKGAILASRRTSYRDLAGKAGFEPELVALMKHQHKDLMRALLAGAFDKDGSAPAVAGASGEHPAEAAAAVAAPRPERENSAVPNRGTPPVVAAPETAPRRDAAPPAKASVTPSVSVTPPPVTAPAATAPRPRPAALTLDEAIRRYLQEFAVAAARGARA